VAREREIVEASPVSVTGIQRNYYDGNLKTITNCIYYSSYAHREMAYYKRCNDELHPFSKITEKGNTKDLGGPLDIWVCQDGGMNTHFVDWTNIYTDKWTTNYVGEVCLDIKPTTLHEYATMDKFGAPGTDSASYGDFSQYGAEAWNKFKPGKPRADLAQFIAEAKDVPRMLKTTALGFATLYKELRSSVNPKRVYQNALGQYRRSGRSISRRNLRGIGNQYLNTQFGWVPFLNDLRKFYMIYKDMETELKELRARNGKWTNVGGTVHLEESTSSTDYVGCLTKPAMNSMMIRTYPATPNQPPCKRTVKRSDYQKVWFRGCFRYYIPDIGTAKWERRAKRALFGSNVTPQLIWELTPWSWLIDWFTNVSSILESLDNGLAENLAAKYAYLMGHTRTVFEVTARHYIPSSGYQTLKYEYLLERKGRGQASPFGFGLDGGVNSPYRASILGALGLSRIR
jgi:hypothetical protein